MRTLRLPRAIAILSDAVMFFAASAATFVLTMAGAEATVTFTDRATFLHSVGRTVTDGYDQAIYGYSLGTPILLTDTQMSAALNQTKYQSTGAKDQNLVGAVFGNNPGAYCAGCNGSFALDFTSTTIGDSKGVFGFGMDIGLNGGGMNGFPSTTPDPYHAFITFGDGTQRDFTLPDVLDPFGQSRFFGIISDSRIMTAAIGGVNGAPINRAAFFGMDNLTIAAVPGPSTLFLVATCAAGWLAVTVWRRRRNFPSPPRGWRPKGVQNIGLVTPVDLVRRSVGILLDRPGRGCLC